jgi:gamma-glutamylcyclotransferase (GGCT)/AIG2-like uncharacterized protein YtfP
VIRPLFAYGTLRDAEYQRELFDRTFAMEPACVSGFIVVTTAGGYLAATARPGATVAGALVHLDAAAYRIADAWEDLTVYERIAITARRADGGPCDCFMYVQAAPAGHPVSDGRLSNSPRAQVVADIRRFRASAGL